jgi:hypothetical protein
MPENGCVADELGELCAWVWRSLGGAADVAAAASVAGPRAVLPAYFDVTGLATASVAAATLAAAEFLAAREVSRLRPVSVDTRAASAAFAAEGLFTPAGWSRPELWDPVAGNYRARDGWIRLHTNYPYHRAVVERLLGAGDRAGVQAAVERWPAGDLETAVVEAGGCAAVMRARQEWLASPPGAAAATAVPVSVAERSRPAGAPPAEPAPLRVPLPGQIAGVTAEWRIEAGPLGRHRAEWSPPTG